MSAAEDPWFNAVYSALSLSLVVLLQLPVSVFSKNNQE